MDRSGDIGCWAARRELWPLEDIAALRGGDGGAAGAHVRGCPACRAWLRADRRLGRRLRRVDGEARAPEGLRRRIVRGIGSPTPADTPGRAGAGGWMPGGWVRFAAAAVLVLALAAGWTERRATATAETGALPEAMARDYVQRVEEEIRLSVTDPSAIRSFFAEHYGNPLDPRVGPGAEIEGAMICWLRDRATAMVMYRVDGRPVAHYRTPVGTTPGEEPPSLRTETRAGVRLARWTAGGELHALVGELSAGELSELARARFGAGGR